MLHLFIFFKQKQSSPIFVRPAENRFLSSRGADSPDGEEAEIIPVEPDQDNACAGKVASFSSSAVHIFQLFRRSFSSFKVGS
jgi:hypothetical protein